MLGPPQLGGLASPNVESKQQMRNERRPQIRVVEGARGRRLMIDNTVASVWNPGCSTTGSVWDALAAPIAALPPGRRRTVAILGLGGGSAARVVRAVAPDAYIVGIEVDDAVLEAARLSFDLDLLDVDVQVGNAWDWLSQETRRFDLILEDVFVTRARHAAKPDWLLEEGLALASRRLSRGGILVSNSLEDAPSVTRQLVRLRPNVVELRVRGFANRILGASSRPLDARQLRTAIGAEPLLRPLLAKLAIRTRAL